MTIKILFDMNVETYLQHYDEQEGTVPVPVRNALNVVSSTRRIAQRNPPFIVSIVDIRSTRMLMRPKCS